MHSDMIDKNQFKEIAAEWEHAHRYSPAPRHRRLLILKLLKTLRFENCLDAGCAQPYLLQSIAAHFQIKTYGCDISTKVIAKNRQQFPQAEFKVLDLASQCWEDKQFDLVISSEVIEHIENWQAAVKHLTLMTKKYLLITVPSGKLRSIDQKLGHFRHFEGEELTQEIKKNHFEIIQLKKHGFPVHSFYKRVINFIFPEKIYAAFSTDVPYSLTQKCICKLLYYLFYFNYFFNRGDQLLILAKRKEN